MSNYRVKDRLLHELQKVAACTLKSVLNLIVLSYFSFELAVSLDSYIRILCRFVANVCPHQRSPDDSQRL